MEMGVTINTVFEQARKEVKARPFDLGMHDILRYALKEMQFGSSWEWLCQMATIPPLMNADYVHKEDGRVIVVQNGRAYHTRHRICFTARVRKPDGVYSVTSYGGAFPVSLDDAARRVIRLSEDEKRAMDLVLSRGKALDVSRLVLKREITGLPVYELPNGARTMAAHIEAVRPRRIIVDRFQNEMPVMAFGPYGSALISVAC